MNHLVRFRPCGHQREVDEPSLLLAALLDATLWCLECDQPSEWALVPVHLN